MLNNPIMNYFREIFPLSIASSINKIHNYKITGLENTGGVNENMVI